MKFKDILKGLDISKWSAVWSFLIGGWAGLAKLICEAFTKLLKKAEPAKLKQIAEFVGKVAVFVRGITDTFITDEAVKAAAGKTADAIGVLAEHIADGEYSTDELDTDIDNIEACVDAWSKVADV